MVQKLMASSAVVQQRTSSPTRQHVSILIVYWRQKYAKYSTHAAVLTKKLPAPTAIQLLVYTTPPLQLAIRMKHALLR